MVVVYLFIFIYITAQNLKKQKPLLVLNFVKQVLVVHTGTLTQQSSHKQSILLHCIADMGDELLLKIKKKCIMYCLNGINISFLCSCVF